MSNAIDTIYEVCCGSVTFGERQVLARAYSPEGAERRKRDLIAQHRELRASGEKVPPFVCLRIEERARG